MSDLRRKYEMARACEPGIRAIFGADPVKMRIELLRLRAVMTLTPGIADLYDADGVPWRARHRAEIR
jgi:hypothetical protein